ncbi:MAG: PhoX family phosphatase [Neisseria sp.]|nr:PhoX family phosphatase [Neisseria sp.]
MSKPFACKIKDPNGELVSNISDNAAFSKVLDLAVSRRKLLQGSAALGAVTFAPLGLLASGAASAQTAGKLPRAGRLGFKSVPFSTADKVIVPKGYTARALYSWGDAVGIAGRMPAFKKDASNTTAEQALQAGMHHDGIAFFPLPAGSDNSNHGLLAMNHEYIDNGLLFPDGTANWDLNKARKGQNAMGVSVIEVKKDAAGQWQVVRPSNYARRITVQTPMSLSGAARGHRLMQTRADRRGETVLGTMQNCAMGQTPWGTYLTCEENWSDIFTKQGEQTALEKRYGIMKTEDTYRWSTVDERFDAAKNPNEPNRFGWVVEIDPYRPDSRPVKHTALGRFKHEGANVVIAPSGQVVVYMGDDQKFEYIYKFVSKNTYNPANRAANMQLLSEGVLYVARFDEDGSGQWLPLIHGEGKLTAANGFADQGEVLVKTRMAADVLGATKMDRPEWIDCDPYVSGSVYCTLTNNNDRGKEGKAPTDAANPRANNLFGHIIHWQENAGDAAAHTFRWDILVMAGRPDTDDKNHQGSMKDAAFGSPDGLRFDHRGVLWIQTDVSTSTLNMKEYQGMGNNQMVATIPGSNEYRRFLTGPAGCEITGIAFTTDNKTLFINIQHPGEPSKGDTDPLHPTAISSWPDHDPNGRPRAATVVITKDNGDVIGS